MSFLIPDYHLELINATDDKQSFTKMRLGELQHINLQLGYKCSSLNFVNYTSSTTSNTFLINENNTDFFSIYIDTKYTFIYTYIIKKCNLTSIQSNCCFRCPIRDITDRY